MLMAMPRVSLSPQAQANLQLSVEPIAPETYWRSIQIPGMVVDWPGHSDRAVTTPATGIVIDIKARPGDTIRAGQPLFTLRLLSETIQNAQAELFKTTRDLQSNAEQRALLIKAGAAIPEQRIVELDNQERRLKATAAAYRQELITRGFHTDQVDGAAEGRFATEITVFVPGRTPDGQPLVTPSSTDKPAGVAYEMKEMKAQLGDQIQAGHPLALLANHQMLLLEGRAFKQESPLLERTAQNSWPIQAEFTEEGSDWPSTETGLKIQYLANTVDPVSRTFAFFLPLANQSRAYTQEGKTFLVWRFRPGQRVRLHVPVEKFEDVFVLPAAAVVREGRRPTSSGRTATCSTASRCSRATRTADTWSSPTTAASAAGQFVAQNAAATLNRVLKAQAAGEEAGHGHDHHGHSH